MAERQPQPRFPPARWGLRSQAPGCWFGDCSTPTAYFSPVSSFGFWVFAVWSKLLKALWGSHPYLRYKTGRGTRSAWKAFSAVCVFRNFTEREDRRWRGSRCCSWRTHCHCLPHYNQLPASALVGKDNGVVIQKFPLVPECTIRVFPLTSLHSVLCCVAEGWSLFCGRFTGCFLHCIFSWIRCLHLTCPRASSLTHAFWLY